MSNYAAFEKLTIHFDSGPIPPPFCHRYTIIVINNSGKYGVSLNLEYYDRDEISEEDIFDEGFSLQDNHAWEGELPEIWVKEIQEKLNSSNWLKKPKTQSQLSMMELRITGSGRSELLYPADQKAWEVFSQEIIQAIFELSKKEAPLKIEFVHIGNNKLKSQLNIHFSFAKRKVEISSSNKIQDQISWKEGQKLMKYIYFFDYLPEEGSGKFPRKPGDYIQPGNALWYNLGIIEKAGKDDKTEKLIKTLKSYF